MKKLKGIFFLLMILSGFCFSQDQHILDSLKMELKRASHDSIRCRLLGHMVDYDYDDNVWPLHNKKLIKISLKYVNEKTIPKTKMDSVFLLYYMSGLNIEGFVCMNEGNIKKALNYFNRILDIEKRMPNKLILASVYNNIAGIHVDEGDDDLGFTYFEKCLKISKETNDKYFMAKAYGNLSKCYDLKNDTAMAKDYAIRALELYKEINDKDGQAFIYNNLGRLYRQQNNRKVELECYLKAYQINKETGNKRAISYLSSNLSSYYNRQGNKKLAYYYANDGFRLAKELGYPLLIQSQAEQLYLLERENKNWEKALGYYIIQDEMHDSILSSENVKASMQQQMKFEFDKQKAIDQANHDKELFIAEEKERKQKTFTFAIGIGFLVVFAFSIFIYSRMRLINKQKRIIEEQKDIDDEKNAIIEDKQKEIIDSINYAKRIQYALLAHSDFLKQHLPNHFVYFKPKDIVSGDFYWATNHNNKFYLAVCDSTGHGVPGAFMSLLSIGFLSEAINEKGIEKPGEVFDFVRRRLVDNLGIEGQKDGFDGILLCIDKSVNRITYASANNSPILIRNNVLEILPKDRMPVGKGEKNNSFKSFEVEIKPDDTIYCYTDGYADQFGGSKGKKFMYKKLNELLLKGSNNKSFDEQRNILENNFDKWRGDLEQVDDVCIIGIRL